jgi:hypothetical protein
MRKLFMVFLVVVLAMAGLVTLAGPALSQTPPECSDGVDNADPEDTIADFPNDPGCTSPGDFHEENAPIPPAGQFSCRASAIRVAGLPLIGTIEPFVANPRVVPCRAQNDSLLSNVTVGPVSAGAVEAVTAVIPGFGAGSFARVVGANVAIGPGIGAEVLRANASVTCSSGSPVLGSESQVTRLVIGTNTVAVPPGHFHITIPGVGTLHLNETITTPNSVTRRALWLQTPSALLPEVVIAEAHADYTGNPCAS